MYVFGAFLIFTGVKIAASKDAESDPEDNPAIQLLRRFIPVTDKYEGQHFFVRHQGQLFATPLLVVLVSVESTDLIFAIDSIPAIFAVTDDPFIVYTSNVLAIFGLARLVLPGCRCARPVLSICATGLGVVLSFVGVKNGIG